MQESVVCCGRALYLPETQRVHGELPVKLVVELLFHCPAGQTAHLPGSCCSPEVGVANPASHSQSDISSLAVLLPVLLLVGQVKQASDDRAFVLYVSAAHAVTDPDP